MTLSDFDVTVATRSDWLALGVTERRFRTLVDNGALVRIRHGVYAVAEAVASAADDPALKHALLATAAIQAARYRPAAVSHESAAILHRLNQLDPPNGVVSLTRDPLSPRNSARDDVKYHSAAVPREHLTVRCGVPTTSAARTVIDLARTSSFMAAVVVADSAIHKLKTRKSELLEVLDFCGQWPGADAAKRVLGFTNGLSESVLESCARVVFAQSGLPAPQLQAEFYGLDYSYRVDFHWPEYDTVAEADGLVKYDDDPRRAKWQLRRDRKLRQHGLKVVHFTWRDLFDTPASVVAWIKEAFSHSSPY